MGAWRSIRHRLEEAAAHAPSSRACSYVGRPWRASPSEGYPTAHQHEQDRIVREALGVRAARRGEACRALRRRTRRARRSRRLPPSRRARRVERYAARARASGRDAVGACASSSQRVTSVAGRDASTTEDHAAASCATHAESSARCRERRPDVARSEPREGVLRGQLDSDASEDVMSDHRRPASSRDGVRLRAGDPGASRAQETKLRARRRDAARPVPQRRSAREPPALQERGAGPHRGDDGRRGRARPTGMSSERLPWPGEETVESVEGAGARRDPLDGPAARLRLGRLTAPLSSRIRRTTAALRRSWPSASARTCRRARTSIVTGWSSMPRSREPSCARRTVPAPST